MPRRTVRLSLIVVTIAAGTLEFVAQAYNRRSSEPIATQGSMSIRLEKEERPMPRFVPRQSEAGVEPLWVRGDPSTVENAPTLNNGGRESANAGARHPQQQDKLEVERIRILPKGFDPSEITRPQGAFFLAVDNSNILGLAQLSLKGPTGLTLKAAALPRGRMGWREVLDLQPGQYRLSDIHHPGAVCLITITDK